MKLVIFLDLQQRNLLTEPNTEHFTGPFSCGIDFHKKFHELVSDRNKVKCSKIKNF